MTEDAIRNRARKEGWTKRAYAAASEQNLGADRAAAAPLKAARACAPAPDEARAVLDEAADGEQVAALALGAAARCIAAGRFVEAERLGKLAETLSRLGSLNGAAGGGSGGSGASAAPDPDEGAWDKPEPAKHSPYEMELMRVEVERRFESLARSFDRTPTPHPLIVAYGLEDAYAVEEP